MISENGFGNVCPKPCRNLSEYKRGIKDRLKVLKIREALFIKSAPLTSESLIKVSVHNSDIPPEERPQERAALIYTTHLLATHILRFGT